MQRFSKITDDIINAASKKVISYRDFVMWCYIDLHCGRSNDRQNPFMKGQKDIANQFEVSVNNVQKAISSLEQKGFLKIVYRVIPKGGSIKGDQLHFKSHKSAWNYIKTNGGRLTTAYYYTRTKPKTRLKKRDVT